MEEQFKDWVEIDDLPVTEIMSDEDIEQSLSFIMPKIWEMKAMMMTKRKNKRMVQESLIIVWRVVKFEGRKEEYRHLYNLQTFFLYKSDMTKQTNIEDFCHSS